jgi:sugar lactone lactonase YvrE
MVTTYPTTVRHTGLAFGEAPRWHEGRLWFSDFFRHGVYSLGDDGERLEVALAHDAQPSGLGWRSDGTLLIVSMTDQVVLAVGADGVPRAHADVSEHCGYWANDMVVAPDGTAYVANFGFDIDLWLEQLADPPPEGAPRLSPRTTALIVVAPDGAILQVTGDLKFPNGMVLSEDGRTLVLAETTGSQLSAFDVAPDGMLSNHRPFATLPGVAPDGICLDAEGQVWVANAMAPQCLRVAEGGEVTASVTTEKNCYACMLGGEDRTTLFLMTATTSTPKVASVARDAQIEVATVAVPGAGLP